VFFDLFSDSVYWVLIPSGLFVCAIGMTSKGFFVKLKKINIPSAGLNTNEKRRFEIEKSNSRFPFKNRISEGV